jgi:uncharacterized protein YceK
LECPTGGIDVDTAPGQYAVVTLRLVLAIRRLHLLPFLLLVLAAPGCGSIGNMARRAHREPLGGAYGSFVWKNEYVYAGVEADLRMIVAPWQPDIQGHSTSGLSFIGVPMGLIDAPLSLAVDTVLLPYDVWMVTAGGRTRSYTPRNEQQFIAQEIAPFLGEWTNRDLKVPDVTRIRISLTGDDKPYFEMWGKSSYSAAINVVESKKLFIIKDFAREGAAFIHISLLPEGNLQMIYSHHVNAKHMVETKITFVKEGR